MKRKENRKQEEKKYGQIRKSGKEEEIILTRRGKIKKRERK
jgi:hypothetical protein